MPSAGVVYMFLLPLQGHTCGVGLVCAGHRLDCDSKDCPIVAVCRGRPTRGVDGLKKEREGGRDIQG